MRINKETRTKSRVTPIFIQMIEILYQIKTSEVEIITSAKTLVDLEMDLFCSQDLKGSPSKG